jgi:hypothetical protein
MLISVGSHLTKELKICVDFGDIYTVAYIGVNVQVDATACTSLTLGLLGLRAIPFLEKPKFITHVRQQIKLKIELQSVFYWVATTFQNERSYRYFRQIFCLYLRSICVKTRTINAVGRLVLVIC